jgi:hypothetical protein
LQQRLGRLDALLPELERRKDSPAATPEDELAWRSAQATRKLTLGQLAHLRGEYWIGVLEEHGVLPNYTLFDDAVLLDVSVSWTDPDTNTFQSEHGQIQRGATNAIREFAPGATFYGRGFEIGIDAIDLGADGAAIRPWVFCPACGFGQDAGLGGQEQYPASCPRCGSIGIADTGQRLRVVELTHVTAEIRRDEATISDRRDDRDRKLFQIVVTADVDEAGVAERWYVDGIGLGCTYARSLTMRWLNLGSPSHCATRSISAEDRTAGLFRVCEGCGKLDIRPGPNLAHEHRPWCKHRASAEEHNVDIALSRTLRTQGLLLRLPYSITLGDDFAVPSLSAALLLGVREQLGGSPDHIGIERVVEPTHSDGSDNHDAILLHDIVPGGTGYLAELADPDRLRDLLVRAWERVRDCDCRDEDRLACHRCLLPFAAPSALRRVSRAAAERHLRALLGLSRDTPATEEVRWAVTKTPPSEDQQSHLEQRFRQAFIQRLEATGAAIDLVPGAWGNTVRFTLPGDRRQWTLTPQVQLQTTRPDFMLQSTDTNVPAIAIFTDGHAFHASTAHDRLADDATKRELLRDSGRLVLGVSSSDLPGQADRWRDPPWYSTTAVSSLISRPEFNASATAYEALRKPPVDWLMDWVTRPTPTDTATVARAVPLLLQRAASVTGATPDASLEQIARGVLLGNAGDGPRRVAVFQHGALAVAFEPTNGSISVAVVLDDRPQALDGSHVDAWRMWLRLSNALALRDWPTTITTLSLVADKTAAADGPAVADVGELGDEWAAVLGLAADDLEREFIRALAQHGDIEVPDVGDEGPGGIVLDVSWPAYRIAVDLHGMPETDRTDLAAVGWRLLPPDAPTVVTQVKQQIGDANGGTG